MSRHDHITTAALQAQCDQFNQTHPVGTAVTVQLDFRDEPFTTVTRSTAQVLSGHSAVIWLEGVTGCYLLDRVTPAIASTTGVSDAPL